MERMMKVQDVLLKAMAKKISWWEAAEIIGVTERTMRRWRQRLEEDGYSGLADRRKGKVSGRRVPLKTCEEVLRLYREKYLDFSIRHFHEKLGEEHGIELSYTWIQQALQGAGLVSKRGGAASTGGVERGARWRDAAAHRWEQASLAEGRSVV
jgi:transposase